ncbi:MAG TPA: hypothetical protein VMF12_19410 [Xanthobacteraceae bacterium]|nr:hypothetical protein [Xanthobacteraceae bacterium]
MRSIVLSKTLAAASVNDIAQSQSLGAAGNLALNGSAVSGGVATLDTQRRILITSAGNDSGITFTVFGATDQGTAIQETVTGANAGAVATNQDFAAVTQVSASAATASTVQVGTNNTGSTRWLLTDQHLTPGNISLGGTVSGSVTYTAEYTYDDFLNLAAGSFALARTVAGLTNATTSTDAQLGYPVKGVRLTINAGAGAAALTVTQAGIKQ